MRTKCFVFIILVLISLGLSGLASAQVIDTSGDAFVPGYDILSADCVVYDDWHPPQALPEHMKAGIEMDDKLPGLVVFEFDVDDDTATGGSLSMTGMFNPCETGGAPKLKVEAGFDIAVMLMLRSQADDAVTAWCTGCAGDLCNTGRERGE